MGSAKNVPGPGQYNPDMSITRAEVQSSKIGAGQRIDLGANRRTKEWPGPGQFNSVDGVSTKVGFKFGSGQRSNLGMDVDDVPGPGRYGIGGDGGKMRKGPAYTMGVNLGSTLAAGRSEDPGPGQYNSVMLKSSGGGKLGKS